MRASSSLRDSAAALVITITLGLFVASLPARGETLIQPGAAVRQIGDLAAPGTGDGCTLNFVFKDSEHTYIGGPGPCTDFVGERVLTADGEEFGTVVYRVLQTDPPPVPIFGGPILDHSALDSFALIRIDPDKLQNVSPVVLGVGEPPTGYTTSDETAEGDEVLMYGQAPGLNQTPATARRKGTLDRDDVRSFWAKIIPTAFGDAGAPVVRAADGKALGVMSYNGVPSTRGTTVERILQLLREAGFSVSLVTEDGVAP